MIKMIKWKMKKEYLRNILVKRRGCRFARHCSVDYFSCVFEGRNVIKDNVILYNCEIGFGTYISNNSRLYHASIGKFCSIGPNVYIISGQHPTRTFVSTSPVFFSEAKQLGFTYVKRNKFEEHCYVDAEQKKYISIGNDVWIGDGAKIMEGVHIADGTIVAAGAIVAKDTEPYSIVGGVPAALIRYRFSTEDIEYLLELQWWNQNLDWIEKNADYFEDIDKLKLVLQNSI